MSVFIDPEQNLISAMYDLNGSGVYVNFLALDGSGVHPKAAGATLIVSPSLPGCQNTDFSFIPQSHMPGEWSLKSLGKHVAVLHKLRLDRHAVELKLQWWIQIWDWQYSTISNCVLNGTQQSIFAFSEAIDY
ncbi:hypothetical protein BDR07DRAFT_1484116 [Suillus spraguei]|nr:hypothetical protein BDR07DRAFT_1484116 [Suillus spraguei]